MAIPPSHSYEEVQTQAVHGIPLAYNVQVSPNGSDSSLPTLASGGTRDLLEELRQAKREIELLKSVVSLDASFTFTFREIHWLYAASSRIRTERQI